MREIKFRGWNKNENIMVDLQKITPLALDDTMNTQMAMQGWGGLFLPFQKDIILMQYAGLKDKNGKEIYEGDIVNRNGWIAEVVFKQRYSWFELEYRKFPHLPHSTTTNEWYSTTKKDEIDFEVIGNIYENPELLKGGDKV